MLSVRSDGEMRAMGHELPVEVEGRTVVLDGRDVAQWEGRTWTGAVDGSWQQAADRYIAEHPRAAGVAESQRLAIVRRLAAGPATRGELLALMRQSGYVGATDLENRVRDLRAGDSRAGGRSGLKISGGDDRYWFTEALPLLDAPDRRALGFAKTMVGRLDGPMAMRAASAMERLLPGVGETGGAAPGLRYPAKPADFERFHEALEQRRPIRVRYFSLNHGREGTYDLVPVEYVTLGTTVKAICVEVTPAGETRRELQFALDRLSAVELLPDWPQPAAAQLVLHRCPIVLHVTDGLFRVMRDRDLFGIATDVDAVQDDEDDSWRVTGSFPVALAWDVMEQLCAWAGNAQVREPLWLVNAVVRRLTAGLRVMQEGGAFELVKPEPERVFASHGEAVSTVTPLPEPTGPRRLQPRR